MRGWHRRVGVALAVLTMSGCATTVSGAPTPGSPAGDPPVTAQQPDPGVPRVAHPRDARHIAACDLLTPTQLENFGADLSTAKSSEQNSGLRCRWRTRDKVGSLEAVVAAELVQNGFVGGLASLYAQRYAYDVFEPGELDGFPIVHADRTSSDIECTIYVGSADDQFFYTAAGYVAGQHDRCGIARRMASAVLSNLPPLR